MAKHGGGFSFTLGDTNSGGFTLGQGAAENAAASGCNMRGGVTANEAIAHVRAEAKGGAHSWVKDEGSRYGVRSVGWHRESSGKSTDRRGSSGSAGGSYEASMGDYGGE